MFIIADASGDMAKILYNDLNKNPEKYVVLDKLHLFNNRLYNYLCRLSISLTLNKHFKMPLKKYFYRTILKRFVGIDDLCFYLGIAWFDQDLVDLIKKTYPKAKLVLNFHDTVESKLKWFSDMNVDKIKRDFNLVYTYSMQDVKKYGFEYTPDMYSKLGNNSIPKFDTCDLVFVGRAKGREETLAQIHRNLVSRGVRCWFYLMDVPKGKRQYQVDGFYYGDKPIPFLEVIGRHVSARCILEVTQEGCVDATLRFWDAVLYNKKIITNCSAVKEYDYYNPNYVFVFDKIDEIDERFIFSSNQVDYHYKGDISPIRVFDNIDKRLSQL